MLFFSVSISQLASPVPPQFPFYPCLSGGLLYTVLAFFPEKNHPVSDPCLVAWVCCGPTVPCCTVSCVGTHTQSPNRSLPDSFSDHSSLFSVLLGPPEGTDIWVSLASVLTVSLLSSVAAAELYLL